MMEKMERIVNLMIRKMVTRVKTKRTRRRTQGEEVKYLTDGLLKIGYNK